MPVVAPQELLSFPWGQHVGSSALPMASIRDSRDLVTAYLAARRRMVIAFAVLLLVNGIGAAGYWYVGWRELPGMWSVADCIYMTAITITTVGFEEVLELDAVPGGREWTLVLLVFGISANLYVVSSITSFFVEGDFTNIRRYRRLQRRMRDIENHTIVCGVGRTGRHVIDELLAIGREVVAIDLRSEPLEELHDKGVITLRADATDDETLERAGLGRARGLVATLDDDRTNLFVVVTARQSHPEIRIVSKAVNTAAVAKLRRAGADAVVAPTMIGGLRLASELVRPQVVRFLDDMLRSREAGLRIEEAVVSASCEVAGKTLQQAALRKRTGVLVIAVRSPDGEVQHAPPPDLKITPGQILIVIGRPEEVRAVRAKVGHGE